ncbi:MAG: CDP-glycerol glycerophosphotransferase family protein [Propionibacteriaceae bacterium]|nr:CDP-glycerol glycerophosphotransferase family protein [Propionibacteriaceae bacterium]
MLTSITWDRVHLHIDVKASLIQPSKIPHRYKKRKPVAVLGNRPDLSFVLRSPSGTFHLKSVPTGTAGTYRVKINVTNLRERREIPDGTWKLIPMLHGQACLPTAFPADQLSRLRAWSKTFLYDNNTQAYVVNFDLSEDDERPEVVMRTYHLSRTVPPVKVTGGIKTRMKAWWMKNDYDRKLVQFWHDAWRTLTPPPGNRVLLAAQQRTKIDGNLRCVRDQLVARGLGQQLDIQEWCDTNQKGFMVNLKSRLRLAHLMGTSDLVLIDDYCKLLDELNPDPKTVIAQLWHAGYGFKAVGFSRFGMYGSPRLESGHRKYTYTICGSTTLQPIYAEVFGIEQAAVLPTGLPRIDEFLDADRIKGVKESFYRDYPALKGKRIVLFAPTFRGRGHADARYDYSRIDFASLHEWCGPNTVILFRMHPFTKTKPPIPEKYQDKLIDFAAYPSTNDLLHMTDILITDYSSIVYEFSLLNKPMLFFAYDEAEYRATRGFHGNYRKVAPGKVCNTFDELLTSLTFGDFDFEKVAQYRQRYFDYTDTGSTGRVIDRLVLPSLPHLKG